MTTSELEKIINKAFDNKQNINEKSDSEILKAVNQTIELNDKSKLRNLRGIKFKNENWKHST